MHIPRALTLLSFALTSLLFSTACSRSEAGSTPGPVAEAASLTPVAVTKASANRFQGNRPDGRISSLSVDRTPCQGCGLSEADHRRRRRSGEAGQLLATIEIPEINDELVRAEAETPPQRRRDRARQGRAGTRAGQPGAGGPFLQTARRREQDRARTGRAAGDRRSLARKRTADAQVAAARAALSAAAAAGDVYKADSAAHARRWWTTRGLSRRSRA